VVSVAQYSAYRSTRNFLYPNDYIPERWLGEPQFENDQRDVVQSFSLGKRDCIGRAMGYLEMRLILARIIYRFDMELDSGDESFAPEKQKVFFFWSKPPLLVRLHDRLQQSL
jgi:cytochrome P450